MKRTLRESLDTQRSKTEAISINIFSKNKKDLTSFLIFGMLSMTYGTGIYYFLPYAMISFNLALAMTVSLAILLGMIFAKALIVVNVLHYINLFVGNILLFFEYG